MTINEIQDEIIAEFADFDDWMDRYQLLIDLGGNQPKLDDKYKTEQNLIDGCQSRVWLQADYADGVITFSAESDALIVKGIVSLLIRVLSGHSPKEIMDADLYFIDRIGLSDHLSPTRSNGLLAMVKQMRMYAVAFNMRLARLTNKKEKQYAARKAFIFVRTHWKYLIIILLARHVFAKLKAVEV